MDKQAHPVLCQERPWANNKNTVWLASTFNLIRNIENSKFPGQLNTNQRKQIIPLVNKCLLSTKELNKPVIYTADDLDSTEKEFLVEHFLSDKSFQQTGEGEAFALDESGEFLATINFHNHLQLHIIDCQGELENTWNRLLKIETSISKGMKYSFSNKFGFLTSDPTECGTALKVTLFLQPSALIHSGQLEDLLEEYGNDTITVTGLQGNPTEIIGDILSIQNSFTLGVNEESILSSLRTFSTKLILKENSLRKNVPHQESAELKDKVSRAYGILLHSYQIDAVEALNAISLMKLGLDLGWLTGTSLTELNQLFFNSRRAHLNFQYDKEIDQEEILHKRAEYIHKTLKNIHLKI